MSDAYEAWLQDTPIRTIVFGRDTKEARHKAYDMFQLYAPDITRRDIGVKKASQYNKFIEHGVPIEHLIKQLGWTTFCDCCSGYVNRNNLGFIWKAENVAYCNDCAKQMEWPKGVIS